LGGSSGRPTGKVLDQSPKPPKKKKKKKGEREREDIGYLRTYFVWKWSKGILE
jgi:ribosomal protein S30